MTLPHSLVKLQFAMLSIPSAATQEILRSLI